MEKALNKINSKGVGHLEGWISQDWWLTAIPQEFYSFRKTAPSKILYLIHEGNPDEECFIFHSKDGEQYTECEIKEAIERDEWKTKKGDFGKIESILSY